MREHAPATDPATTTAVTGSSDVTAVAVGLLASQSQAQPQERQPCVGLLQAYLASSAGAEELFRLWRELSGRSTSRVAVALVDTLAVVVRFAELSDATKLARRVLREHNSRIHSALGSEHVRLMTSTLMLLAAMCGVTAGVARDVVNKFNFAGRMFQVWRGCDARTLTHTSHTMPDTSTPPPHNNNRSWPTPKLTSAV